MAINTYGTLKTAVANWLAKDNLSSYIPDFIALGEQRIYHGGEGMLASEPVRVPAMQTRATGTISSSSISFPTRFIEIIRLAASSGGETWTLEYCPPDRYSDFAASSALPTVYTYLNNAILTGGTGAASYTLDYYASFAALASDSDTNSILTNAPGIFLYAALIEAAPFLYDDPRVGNWHTIYQSAVASYNRSMNRKASGSLSIRLVT